MRAPFTPAHKRNIANSLRGKFKKAAGNIRKKLGTKVNKTPDGPVQMPTAGSQIKRNVALPLTVGLAGSLVGGKIARDRYFKNKEKDKK